MLSSQSCPALSSFYCIKILKINFYNYYYCLVPGGERRNYWRLFSTPYSNAIFINVDNYGDTKNTGLSPFPSPRKMSFESIDVVDYHN